MNFTDIFIKRPVLAIVVSLVILLLGLRAGQDLTVREYPELQNAQVSVIVAYPGAEPALVEGFVTTPLEREIASADGIDFLTSKSHQFFSGVQFFLRSHVSLTSGNPTRIGFGRSVAPFLVHLLVSLSRESQVPVFQFLWTTHF